MKKLTILQTSDIHGSIYPLNYGNNEKADVGLGKIATKIKQERALDEQLILIDNGDLIQGTPLTYFYVQFLKDKNNPMISLLNHLSYDAAVIGNHEFNYGLDVLNRIKGEANFPALGANIYNEDGTNFVKPYIVKEVNGVKVGILGMISPNVPRWDTDKVVGMKFNSLVEEGKKWVKVLREEEKVDVIIASIHAGMEGEYWEDGGDSVKAVAEQVPGIDIILAGHAHSDFAGELVNGVLISEPKSLGNRVARFDVTVQKENDAWKITEKTATNYDTKTYEAAPEILELAKVYDEKTLEYVNTPIGEATADFQPANEVPQIPATQLQDTALVDFINKVQLEIPAGKMEKGETPIKCAARELEEETGYKANKLTCLGSIVTAPGFCDEVIHIFKAEELTIGNKGGDDDEFIELKVVSLEEMREMVKRGEIIDTKTISSLAYL